MRRILAILFCATMIFGLAGCGFTKSIEDIAKDISAYTDKVFISFNGDLYDFSNNCYNGEGIKKTCDRIMDVPENQITLIIMNEENEKIALSLKDNEIISRTFFNDLGGYQKDVDGENSFLLSNGSNDFCTHTIVGENQGIYECDESRKRIF